MNDIKDKIKNSLNMTFVDFPMKANLPQNEPLIQDRWFKNNIYNKALFANKKQNNQWILHDGPPYANGDLHVGHALNIILKDIIIRSKNMQGFYSPFVLGWDTHGLPIEHALAKKIGKDYQKMSMIEKRHKCYEFALKNVENQMNQFKKFGLFTDYDDIYMTMNKDFESHQLYLFLTMLKKKLVYQALKPIYWSWSSQTALADAEIEYKDIEAYSIYLTFDVADGKNILHEHDKLVIWTTTPWTIPSNLAIAINPKFEYCLLTYNNKNYIIAKKLLQNVVKLFNWNNYQIKQTFMGQQLENITYYHPFYKRTGKVILADYVSIDDGTGLVHNAPDHGSDDYIACKKYKIDPFEPIDKFGNFTSVINDNELIGKFYNDTNEIIINRLKKSNCLICQNKIIHSAAVDWRTKKPVIYRATKQWFVDIDSIKNDIINNLQKVKFQSKHHKDHMIEMIKNRSEWCISRQRIWGVPIPIIYDENDNPILDIDLNEHIINVLSTDGVDCWFTKPIEYFLTKQYTNRKLHKCFDTMDVWFDSGSSHLMFETNQWGKQCALYLEGNDQYRGWFNSSIITSTIVKNISPYQQLISHGMVVDEQGRKMSKSLGNGVDPIKVCQQFGADILRLWAANSDYVNDVSISTNILNQNSEIYRRIRNSLFRFCLNNIADFTFKKDNHYSFQEEELYVINQIKNNINIINNAYNNFDFSTVVKIINKHVIELSSWYFDLIKDSLYCDHKDDPHRKAIQTVLYILFKTYLCFLAPIIPHTASEAYEKFNAINKKDDIMLETWITKLDFDTPGINLEKWKLIFKIKDIVFMQIEKLRKEKIVNKNNEVDVELVFDNSLLIRPTILKKILNVAKLTIIDKKNIEIMVNLHKTKYTKCIRCWNYYPPSEIINDLCPRCQKLIKN